MQWPFRSRQHKRIVAVLLLTTLMLLGVVGQVLAYPAEWCLGVPNAHQEQGNWCWAASSVSILGYYGKNVGQCQFVGWVKGTSPNCPNQTATDSEAQRGLAHWGVCSTLTTSSLSFNTIIAETYNNSRPIYVGWSWRDGRDGGHALVCDGYSVDAGQYVYYMDPADGAHHFADYSWFVDAAGQHIWDGSLYQMRGC